VKLSLELYERLDYLNTPQVSATEFYGDLYWSRVFGYLLLNSKEELKLEEL